MVLVDYVTVVKKGGGRGMLVRLVTAKLAKRIKLCK